MQGGSARYVYASNRGLIERSRSPRIGEMNKETVTASEIADFVYCPESWRLAQTANRAVQQAGIQHHASKATAERPAGGSIVLARRAAPANPRNW